MAPHMLRDYHSTRDPVRYLLRTTKHSANKIQRSQHIDTSRINGKEDFFRSIGLQIKRFQYKYKTLNSKRNSETVNIPFGVMLRDCSVIILKVACKICRRCFKCKTDLNVHIEREHLTHSIKNTNMSTEEILSAKSNNAICEISPKPFGHAIITINGDSKLKLPKRFQLTLKIGQEVVAKKSVKRKHLKVRTSNLNTRTELKDATEFITNKNGCGGSVSRIDPLLFPYDPFQCCNPTLHVENSTNQYLNSNNVTSKKATDKDGISAKENFISNMLTKSCAEYKSCNSTPLSSEESNTISIPFEELYKIWRTYRIPNGCSKQTGNDRTIPVVSDTSVLPKNVSQYHIKGVNENKKRDDINGNEVLQDIALEEQLQNTITSTMEPSVISKYPSSPQHQLLLPQSLVEALIDTLDSKQLLMLEQLSSMSQGQSASPQQMPIPILELEPTQMIRISSLSNSQEGSAHSQQCSSPHQQVMHPPQLLVPEEQPVPFQNLSTLEGQQPLIHKQQSALSFPNSTSAQYQNVTTTTHPSDDDIQEVLRIVRGSNSSADINHESPNRLEQEILLLDGIRSMRKVEEQSCSLKLEAIKKRKRAFTLNPKSDGVNSESTTKKKNVGIPLNTERILKNQTNINGQNTKIYTQNKMLNADTLKENLIIPNKNINHSREILRKYGINLYNDTLETNCNMENVQGSISHVLVPCSRGIETRCSKPIVIDLVNDTDE